jgi:hypothetical protein
MKKKLMFWLCTDHVFEVLMFVPGGNKYDHEKAGLSVTYTRISLFFFALCSQKPKKYYDKLLCQIILTPVCSYGANNDYKVTVQSWICEPATFQSLGECGNQLRHPGLMSMVRISSLWYPCAVIVANFK